MLEEELTKLYKKILTLKNNYEESNSKRIKLVEEIEELDKQISEYDDTQKEMTELHKNYIMSKERIIKGIKRGFSTFFIALIITLIINIVIKDFTKFGFQTLFLLTLNGAINILPPFIIHITDSKIKRITPKDVNNAEKDCQDLIEKRLAKGVEYKITREKELVDETLYKSLTPMIMAQITHIEQIGERYYTKKDIDLKDIYYKIKLSPSFDEESIENKKIILDEELRKYLSSKLSEIYNNVVKPEELEMLPTEELVKLLINEIPLHKHNEILPPLIHAIINFSSNLQGYGVVWFEEQEQSLIETPEVTFDEEGKWTEFKTHKNTDYQTLFDIVYDVFINKVMKKQSSPTRKRV